MRTNLFLLSFLLSFTFFYSQNTSPNYLPNLVNSTIHIDNGTIATISMKTVIEDQSGKYVASGSKDGFLYVISFQENGSVNWRYSSSNVGESEQIIKTNNGDYLVLANGASTSYEVHIISLDNNGNVIYDNTLAGYYSFGGVVELPDGSFLVAANTSPLLSSSNQKGIVKIAPNGSVIWDERRVSSNYFFRTAPVLTNNGDGSFFVGGDNRRSSDTNGIGYFDFGKYDSDGNLLNEYQYQVNNGSYFHETVGLSTFIKTNDTYLNNYILAGGGQSFGSGKMISVDSNGQVLSESWGYPPGNNPTNLHDVQKVIDTECGLIANTFTGEGRLESFTNESGGYYLDSKWLSEENWSSFSDLKRLSNGSFIALSDQFSNNASNGFKLIKLKNVCTMPFEISGQITNAGVPIPNHPVKIWNPFGVGSVWEYQQTAYTDNNGNYKLTFPIDNPENGVFFAPIPHNTPDFVISPSEYRQISLQRNAFQIFRNLDFDYVAQNHTLDIAVELIPLNNAKPGFSADYKLIVKNVGSQNVIGGDAILQYDMSKIDNVSISTTGNSTVLGDKIYWTYSNLQPLEQIEYSINLVLKTPQEGVNEGDILQFIATAPLPGDTDTSNNLRSLNQIVVNSNDPNDIIALEGEIIAPAQAQDYLHYRIRFQNVGSAPATNVRIETVMSEFLDADTFEFIASSHLSSVNKTNGNKLTFNFNNIELAGSYDEANSHGWMIYKVKPKTSFGIGNIINSTAGIYFDFNDPVITNTFPVRIEETLANVESKYSKVILYPNPAKEEVYYSFKQNVKVSEVEIYDSAGKLIRKPIFTTTKVDLSFLKTGIYIINFKTDSGIITEKLIVK